MLRADEMRAILQAATACLPAGETHTSEEIARAVLAGVMAYDAVCDAAVRSAGELTEALQSWTSSGADRTEALRAIRALAAQHTLRAIADQATAELGEPAPPADWVDAFDMMQHESPDETARIARAFSATLTPRKRVALLAALSDQLSSEVSDGEEGEHARPLLPFGQGLAYNAFQLRNVATEQVERLDAHAGVTAGLADLLGRDLSVVARALDGRPYMPVGTSVAVYCGDGWSLHRRRATPLAEARSAFAAAYDDAPVAATTEIDPGDAVAGLRWAGLVCHVCGWSMNPAVLS